jgi:hypothetical protein
MTKCQKLANRAAASAALAARAAGDEYGDLVHENWRACAMSLAPSVSASVSIYRRVKPRVLSKNAATHSLLADLHDVDLSCSRDSPVVRLKGASLWGRATSCPRRYWPGVMPVCWAGARNPMISAPTCVSSINTIVIISTDPAFGDEIADFYADDASHVLFVRPTWRSAS